MTTITMAWNSFASMCRVQEKKKKGGTKFLLFLSTASTSMVGSLALAFTCLEN